MPDNIAWRDLFCGRERELSALEAAYRKVAAGDGPRLVVVLGDRGMGKTRLVQELYRRLTTRHDPQDYWPDAGLFRGNNLLPAPDFTDPATRAHFESFKLTERRLPFLWWGLRISDPEDRNAARTDFGGDRRTLDPHLEHVRYSRQSEAVAHERKALGTDVVHSVVLKSIEAIPLVGWAVSAILELVKKLKELRDNRKKGELIDETHNLHTISAGEAAVEKDLLSRTADDLSALLNPTGQRVPLVLFCDDAQFARTGNDEATLRLLVDIWRHAALGRWPLLLVATHWQLDWKRGQSDALESSFAGSFASAAANPTQGETLDLGIEPALARLAECALPGLSGVDIALLLRRADGNPQVLIELINLLLRKPAWRDPAGPLTAHGRRQVEEVDTELARLILQRLEGDATPADVRRAVALSSVPLSASRISSNAPTARRAMPWSTASSAIPRSYTRRCSPPFCPCALTRRDGMHSVSTNNAPRSASWPGSVSTTRILPFAAPPRRHYST